MIERHQQMKLSQSGPKENSYLFQYIHLFLIAQLFYPFARMSLIFLLHFQTTLLHLYLNFSIGLLARDISLLRDPLKSDLNIMEVYQFGYSC